jgi:hypothetical protein
MVLRDTAFIYYDERPKNKFAKPSGLMELTAETTVRTATRSKPFVFEIVTRPHIVLLKAASQKEVDMWVSKLNTVVAKLKLTAVSGQPVGKSENRRGWLVKRAVKVSMKKLEYEHRFYIAAKQSPTCHNRLYSLSDAAS